MKDSTQARTLRAVDDVMLTLLEALAPLWPVLARTAVLIAFMGVFAAGIVIANGAG